MTTFDKLDEFAKAVLTGMFANPHYDTDNMDAETIAEVAYDIAEAMVKERAAVTEAYRLSARGKSHCTGLDPNNPNDKPVKADGFYSWTED